MAIPSVPGRLGVPRSLVWRNLLLFLLILLVAVVPLGWRYYADSRAYEIRNLAAQLEFFATRGASWVDVAAIPQLTQPAHMYTPMYRTLVRTLHRIEREFDVDNAIIMRREADGQYTYVAAGNGGAGTIAASREARRNPCNPSVATEEGVFAVGQPVHLHAWFPATYTATNETWQRGEMQHSQLFGGKVDGKTFDHFVQINTPLKLHDQVVAILMLNKFANPVAAAVRTKTLKVLGLTVGIVVVGLLLVRSHTPLLKRLEASAAQFRALLESAPDGLIIVDARGEGAPLSWRPSAHAVAGTIVLVNQQAETLFGYAREELLGQPVEMLMPVRFRDTHRQHRGEYVAAPQVRPMGTARELCGVRKDGSEFPVEVGLSPLDTVGGRLVISAIRDITARKQMEEALHQARAAAEQANAAKSQFLASMSHELRTPLNGVLGYAQILQRDPTVNPEQRATLEAIAHCGHLLLTLINDVLDLARIESGQLDVELGPCDLPHLLHSVQDIVRPRAEAKGVRVMVDIAPLVPRCIRTDATKLEQVLVNLLGNAVKFTEHGTITVRAAAPSDTQLTVDVQDTGIGIAPEHVHTIFAPFTQTARGKVAGGTGLGLAISQRLVAALGGTLEVTSTVGVGSCFTIVLPLVAVDAPPLVAPGAPSRPEMWAPVLAPGQDVTVLIADDHDINRDVLVRMLAGAGFRTVQARDGEEALSLLRQHRMPVVFMDIDMPGMDGLDAAHVIRADAMLRDTALIAVTAHALPEVHQQILAGGYDACLTKPFRMADIFDTIARHLPVQFVDQRATAAAETAPAPASALPPALAQDAARRLRDALDIGDIMAITVIAAELRAHPETPAHYGEAIHRYAMAFDMQALRRLVDTLDHRATNSRE